MSWTKEGSAMAHFRFSRVLYALGQESEASNHRKKAEAIRKELLDGYSEYLPRGLQDEQEIHDQMISIWAGRSTGRLKRTLPAELS